VTVDIITAGEPCRGWCIPHINSGEWLGRLQVAGGGEFDIRLRVWSLHDNGRFELFSSQT
jgi:hypothetical protein